MEPLRAVTLIGHIIEAQRRRPQYGVRMCYKSYLYPYLTCQNPLYKEASIRRDFVLLSRIRNRIRDDIAQLVHCGLLYQCHIRRPVRAIYTAVPMKYKHWYTCEYTRFYTEVLRGLIHSG